MATKRKIPFNVSARTAKLIGLENFANSEGAIIELVKNAYDADADHCFVIFDIQSIESKSAIYIIDDGCGMTDETIINKWMTIGTNDKVKNSVSEKYGRVKSGAKGIGRFALNKLGRNAEMLTFPYDSVTGYDWMVNWRDFDIDGINLSDINASLEEIDDVALHKTISDCGLLTIPEVRDIVEKDYSGTVIKVSGLCDQWNDISLSDLYNNLEVLIPSHLSNDFELYLFDINNLNGFGKVNGANYEDYDYKIDANYEGNGAKSIKISIERNELNLSQLETNYSDVFNMPLMKSFPYRLEDFRNKKNEIEINISSSIQTSLLENIGHFSFTFYFVKNTISDDSDYYAQKKYPYNSINPKDRRNWLKRFGGIKIYRDDFRVRPYGEPGNDWLRLGERQSQSPGGAGQKLGGYRLRPNQVSGAVYISRFDNSILEDKSNREGIQESQEYDVFKNLIIYIIEAFERDRNTIMFSLSQLYKKNHPESEKAGKLSKELIDSSKSSSSESKKPTRDELTLAEGYQSLENELNDKEAEIRLLRGLASNGIAVATVTHELHSLLNLLDSRTDNLVELLREYINEDQFKTTIKYANPFYHLNVIKDDDKKIHQWLSYALTAIRKQKREKTKIDISAYFEGFRSQWVSPLKEKNIYIYNNPKSKEQMLFYGYEMDLDSVFNNFITNSVASLIRTDINPKIIKITYELDHDFVVVDFEDNGHGLDDEYKRRPEVIFNSFETSIRDNRGNKIGTGMGLYIAKSIIESYADASIAIIPQEKGFRIRIILKIESNE